MAFETVTRKRVSAVKPGVVLYPNGRLRLQGIDGFRPGMRVTLAINRDDWQLRINPDERGLFKCIQSGAGVTINVKVPLALLGAKPSDGKIVLSYTALTGQPTAVDVDLSGVPSA